MTDRPTQLSQDVARAMNLLAHPLGGLAAASAVGLGMATQAWGLWFGAVAGAMETSRRASGDAAPADSKAQTIAAVKARTAAKNLMSDAQSAAREMAGTTPRRAAAGRSPKRAVKPAPTKSAPAPAASKSVAKAGASMAKPAALEEPARPDDLKAISGIGPKLEQVLNAMGIWTYEQIAGWTRGEVEWVDDQLGFAGRIARDDWVAQAKKLASERTGR